MINYYRLRLRGRTALQLVVIFYLSVSYHFKSVHLKFARKLQQSNTNIWPAIFHPLCGGPDQLTVSSVLVFIRTS